LGIEVIEQMFLREFLYISDEVFFTGSAAEVTPIRTIDKIQIGKGKAGPVTKQLQQTFFDIIGGKREDKHGWLTKVPSAIEEKVSTVG
jgi:branched-chain amino acid aminotransferase